MIRFPCSLASLSWLIGSHNFCGISFCIRICLMSNFASKRIISLQPIKRLSSMTSTCLGTHFLQWVAFACCLCHFLIWWLKSNGFLDGWAGVHVGTVSFCLLVDGGVLKGVELLYYSCCVENCWAHHPIWLVVWNMNLIFPYGSVFFLTCADFSKGRMFELCESYPWIIPRIIPIYWLSYFSEGLSPPTSNAIIGWNFCWLLPGGPSLHLLLRWHRACPEASPACWKWIARCCESSAHSTLLGW